MNAGRDLGSPRSAALVPPPRLPAFCVENVALGGARRRGSGEGRRAALQGVISRRSGGPRAPNCPTRNDASSLDQTSASSGVLSNRRRVEKWPDVVRGAVMSVGGDGVVEDEYLVEVARPAEEDIGFIPRRFRAGGRLGIVDHQGIQSTVLISCVLCGRLLLDHEANDEHPLPQWLHRYAGDVGERRAWNFKGSNEAPPTWRQLCLASHKKCNSAFAHKIEKPAISVLKQIVEGGRVTWTQLDALFDWLDKVRSSSAHMAAAVLGHKFRLGYDEFSFPNRRIGAFDRTLAIFKTSSPPQMLNLWDCLSDGFLSTPSSIALQVKDYVFVFTSNNFLLSSAFGLGTGRLVDGVPVLIPGTGRFMSGYGTRVTRLSAAKIFAQPMRRQHQREGLREESQALQESGDGRIYELIGSRWTRVGSTDFAHMSAISAPLGYALASLETVEWIILNKEQDSSRYREGPRVFMDSMLSMQRAKLDFLDLIASLRRGLRLDEDDRPRKID